MVDSEPSLPWVIALSMVTISSPSTSPTITRLGFIRSERRTSSAMEMPPWPSEFGSRSSNATTFGCSSGKWSRPSSSARSTVISRSLGRDLVRQRPQQRGLPRVGGPGDHDVLSRGRRGGQERGHFGQHRAVADQVGEEHLAQPGAADGHRWPQRHVHDRRQPGAVRQPQVQLRIGGVERPAGQARVGGECLDQLDQFLVAFGDRLGHHLPPVGVAEEHPVAAVDVDVLDLRVLQQGLQPADPEQRGVDGGGELFLLLGVERGVPGGDLAAGVLLQHLADERAGELPFVLARHRRHAGRGVQPALLGQPVAHLGAQPLDQAVIHAAHPSPDGPGGTGHGASTEVGASGPPSRPAWT